MKDSGFFLNPFESKIVLSIILKNPAHQAGFLIFTASSVM